MTTAKAWSSNSRKTSRTRTWELC